ncbi:hypothetical protein OG613_44160 (plasmid) [Streptomyces sp. NBC_00015]|uniref:hypothetical protein n=1 Tax=Streptomyces sp. NBC_00015 TaxID=2903611 RepID=UPI002F910341
MGLMQKRPRRRPGPVLEEVEDAEKLVIYAGALLKDVERHQEARQRAAVTRQWLRDQGYDIPDHEREPGL